jgi:hypothetical protein
MRLDLEDDSDLIHFTKEEDELWRAIELLRYQFQNGDYRLVEVKSASEETRE